MEKRNLKLMTVNDEEFEVVLSPANRNVRLALNKIEKKEEEARLKLIKEEKYKEVFEKEKLKKAGEYNSDQEIEDSVNGYTLILNDFNNTYEAQQDSFLIEKIKAIINFNTILDLKKSELIKSKNDSEFWLYQDLAELRECLQYFRSLYSRRRLQD